MNKVEIIKDEVVTVEEQIKYEVKKYSIADTEIQKLKEKYAGLKVESVEDKAGLKLVKEALSDIVSRRTGIDKKRKELGADYRKIVQAINDEAKRLTELILEIEEPLRAERDRAEQLLKEEKERAEKEAQAKLDARVAELKELGMQFDGSFYVVGNITMDIVSIKGLSDTDYEFLKAKVELEAERVRKEAEEEAARIAEEERKKEEERKEFERQQAELKKQQEEFRKQQEEIERQKKELERKQAEARKEEEERKARIAKEEEERKQRAADELFERRCQELEKIGFAYSHTVGGMLFNTEAGHHTVSIQVLRGGEEDFVNALEQAHVSAKELKQKEREVIKRREEEEKERLLAEEKEKKRLEEEKEKARLAALPDVEKIENYLTAIWSVEAPEIETEEIKVALNYFRTKMKEVSEKVLQSVNKHK